MSATASAEPAYPHIALAQDGAPLIAGTTMKVVELIMAQRAHGWSPEELSFQFQHLRMSEIHAALAYYWDHQRELDADIERRTEFAEMSRREAMDTPLAQRLAALKHGR